ncbi:MAG TPA: phosphoribosylanthranilate isomerase [Candidatus Polarisedimenticolia bacterium]|nr:phosphoribosylanthranilate isomerase [Candidatus Polarisedimenticolia bacterium]
MRIRIKVCGITTGRDAQMCVDAGADALGFVFYDKSPRRIQVEDAARIGRDVPPYVARIGVFVQEDPASLASLMNRARLSAAQLHGDQDDDFCRDLDLDWYPVFRVADDRDIAVAAGRIANLNGRAFMLDSRSPSAPGGTGGAFDWRLAAKLSMRTSGLTGAARSRMILAGGLTPENVEAAIRTARPWAVDVSSGVERAPGLKDPDLVKNFIEAVRCVG